MEGKLLAALVQNRDIYEQAASHIDFKSYGADFEFIVKQIAEYYLNDRDATHVDVDLLKAVIFKTTSSDKQAKRLADIVDYAANTSVSVANVSNFILAAKQYELETRLSTALINHNKPSIAELLEEYLAIKEATELDSVDDMGVEILQNVDFIQLLKDKVDHEHSLKVLPLSLGARIGGYLSGGNHVIIYGPPEVGKSALAITLSSGFLRQGATGLYIENEEPAKHTVARFASHLSGLDLSSVLANPAEARAKASENGYSGLTVVGLPGGTVPQLDSLIRRYKPRWMVVNQLHNLHVRSESEVTKRLVQAQAMRNLAKKYDLVVVSVTQASGESVGKAVLDIEDIYFSNIAVQGAVDLMLGVGMNKEMNEAGIRSISYPKNKLNGEHGHVMVQLQPQLSKMKSAGG